VAEAKRKAELTVREKVAEAERRRQRTNARWMRRGGAAALAVGGLLGVASAWYGHRARSLSEEVSNLDQWVGDARQKYDAAISAETRMYVLAATGALLGIGGGVLLYLGRTPRERPAAPPPAAGVTWAPVPLVGGAGLAVECRF
jgi:hypothetical protein